ncbi:MAG: hypothetical protein HYX68_05890 [Planctomycetes bacterium]|nr:hypothetical protein [Planctomycetota bacterium]
MERNEKIAEGSAPWKLPTWAWLGGVVALLAWQAWLTLALFGSEPWVNLTDDRPIVSGAHPQNLYLASLGAAAFTSRGRTIGFDDKFQAGFLKTPIFDGARLAEVWLVAGGGGYNPAAYKIGFAIVVFLMPWFMLIACKALDISHGASLLATFLGQLIWWGPHGRVAMETGDCGLYLAALASLAHIGFLIAFHRGGSVTAWFGLFLTAGLVWFLQPLFLPIALPVLLTYYLSVGAKHDFLTWHFAFWGAEFLAVAINLAWLSDWVDSWWLRTPLPAGPDLLAHRTFSTLWNAPIWGGETSRLIAVLLLAAGLVGVLILNQTRQRPTARLLALSSGGALTLALLGISWEPLGTVGTAALFAPSLWFACIPAALALTWTSTHLWRLGWVGRIGLAGLTIGAGAGVVLLTDGPICLNDRCLPGEALEIGLDARREHLVQALVENTSSDARILWEDRKRPRHASRWSALLPRLTGRSCIGGLDPDGFIVHSSISLIDEALEGRPIASWDDDQLRDYCRRYNVRWIVAWSPAVIHRLEEWGDAKKQSPLVDQETGWLFEVKRTPSLALRGQAEFLEATGHSIRLANVVPQNGIVVLSLHFQPGMRTSPGRVQIEKATLGDDPIGFIRLRLEVPASRVTVTWDR